MFKEEKWWYTVLNFWRLPKPEEELYARLKDNPFWPFKQVGDGFYQVVYRSDRVTFGWCIMIAALIPFVLILVILGFVVLALGFFIVIFLFGIWAVSGQVGWRELVISTRGKGKYMVRMLQNQEILLRNDIRNVYIRLSRKIDSQNDPHYFLVIGGFGIDDIRMTRMTRAEGPMKIMGMRIAYRVGINFFDWKDESEEHLVWHYKSFSKKIIKTKTEVATKRDGGHSPSVPGSLPDIRINTQVKTALAPPVMVPPKNKQAGEIQPIRSSTTSEDYDDINSKRKVRINKEVNVRTLSTNRGHKL